MQNHNLIKYINHVLATLEFIVSNRHLFNSDPVVWQDTNHEWKKVVPIFEGIRKDLLNSESIPNFFDHDINHTLPIKFESFIVYRERLHAILSADASRCVRKRQSDSKSNQFELCNAVLILVNNISLILKHYVSTYPKVHKIIIFNEHLIDILSNQISCRNPGESE